MKYYARLINIDGLPRPQEAHSDHIGSLEVWAKRILDIWRKGEVIIYETKQVPILKLSARVLENDHVVLDSTNITD